MSKGVQFQGSFTWQKSLHSSSSGAGSDSYGNSLSSLHWYDLSANKSLSDYNTPRVLTLSTVWEIPTPSRQSLTTNAEELRQVLRLKRELNQPSATPQ